MLISSQFSDQSGVYECLIMLNRATHPLTDFPQPRRDRRVVRFRIGCPLFPVDEIFSRDSFDFGRRSQPDDGIGAFFGRPHKWRNQAQELSRKAPDFIEEVGAYDSRVQAVGRDARSLEPARKLIGE